MPATDSEGHWIPAEGERLEQILDYLQERGYDMAQIMVISPFREISRRLWQFERTLLFESAPSRSAAARLC